MELGLPRRRITLGQYTEEEVQKHSTPKSLWVIINRRVYDITTFHKWAPCGAQVLLQFGGKDASSAAQLGHKNSLPGNLMKEFMIGSVVKEKTREKTLVPKNRNLLDVADSSSEISTRSARFPSRKGPKRAAASPRPPSPSPSALGTLDEAKPSPRQVLDETRSEPPKQILLPPLPGAAREPPNAVSASQASCADATTGCAEQLYQALVSDSLVWSLSCGIAADQALALLRQILHNVESWPPERGTDVLVGVFGEFIAILVEELHQPYPLGDAEGPLLRALLRLAQDSGRLGPFRQRLRAVGCAS